MKLGELGGKGTDELGERDAYHVPCVRVSSKLEINPGALLTFVSYSAVKLAESVEDAQAVADPFVVFEHGTIPANTPFYALLRPGLAKNLTHHFDAAGLPNPPDEKEREDDDADHWCGEAGCD